MNLISANSREVLVYNPDNPENFTYDAAGNKLRTTIGRQMTFGPILPHSSGETAEPQGGGLTGGLPGGEIVNPIPSSNIITTDYCGNAIYRGDTLSMLLTEEGYITFTNDTTPVYHYYLKDHLGSIRVVFDQSGTVEQRNDYYASGALMPTGTNGTLQPYKFGGKELERTAGLDEYDFGARWMDPVTMRWDKMDPLCEKYYRVSPYAYCHGDPVNAVDPDGRSTYVINLGNGKYTVMGGNLYDNDLNIYVYTKDKDGEYTIRGESIGKTPLMSSFYNSDANQGKGSWAKGSIIDVNDMSGINFIQDVKGNDVSLLTYIANAFNNHKYDFKATNGTDAKIYDVEDYYRGMPIKMENGEILYTSACRL